MSAPHLDARAPHTPSEKQVRGMVLLSLVMFFVMSFAAHRIFVVSEHKAAPSGSHHETPAQESVKENQGSGAH